MTKIDFQNSISYIGNRPYADVRLGSASPTYKCLVDTGADYLQLPASAAAAIGLSLANAVPHSVTTASGTTIFRLLPKVSVDIEGQRVNVDVLFDPTDRAPPLAGRGVLLAAFELGFQPTKWLWV